MTWSTLDGVFILLRTRPQDNQEILDREHQSLTSEDT